MQSRAKNLELFPAPPTSSAPQLDTYDRIVVAFSGGKDSLACVLQLLDLGVPKDRLELWHHDVDGGPGAPRFMDWPVTTDYCRRVASALELPLLMQWKLGGFKQEMLRTDAPTAATAIQLPDGTVKVVGGDGPRNTRRMFPQVSADLRTRWCSSYLKIDVAARAFSNDVRYDRGRFLMVTGERAQESAARARYRVLEPHRSHSRRRHVDHWRPVLEKTEAEVWAVIRRHRINPHPAYRLGFGRVSCMACIFGNDGQWAAVKRLAPDRFEEIAAFEQEFGKTIHRTDSVRTRAARGLSIIDDAPEALRVASQREVFDEPVFIDPWVMPAGAFTACGGPT